MKCFAEEATPVLSTFVRFYLALLCITAIYHNLY
jgi:hypothetical protein